MGGCFLLCLQYTISGGKIQANIPWNTKPDISSKYSVEYKARYLPLPTIRYHDTRHKSSIHQIIRAILEPNAINQSRKRPFYQYPRHLVRYSNSIVPGGFPVQSYSTLFTPFTSFTIRLVTVPNTSQGICTASAVIKSEVLTALSATA